ncbi:hypothetical protein V6N12_075226 [Hibiscus sabdariffa]|uniref:Uncharacterized protein n=1 Tax=Hibiscus sabdariffa TaxID=183260 RepID=A0ABR2BZV4_9ROSI
MGRNFERRESPIQNWTHGGRAFGRQASFFSQVRASRSYGCIHYLLSSQLRFIQEGQIPQIKTLFCFPPGIFVAKVFKHWVSLQ